MEISDGEEEEEEEEEEEVDELPQPKALPATLAGGIKIPSRGI
jgi:hypothetical protein